MMWTLVIVGLLVHVGAATETCSDVVVTGQEDGTCTCTCSCDVEPTCIEEPTTTESPAGVCTIGADGGAGVTGFDGGTYEMESESRFLSAGFKGLSPADPCKYLTRVDTTENPDGQIVISSLGIAYGSDASNPNQYANTMIISAIQGTVQLGTADPANSVGPGCYETVGSVPYTFCLTGGPGFWELHMETPSEGCKLTVSYTEGDPDMFTIAADPYYMGLLEGMCGNFDGDPSNDPWCANTYPGVPQNCVDGIDIINACPEIIPTESLYYVTCTAGFVGKNVVTGFDGSTYSMNSNGKFLGARFNGRTATDPCKFQVRVDTEDDPNNPDEYQVGWMGAAYGASLANPNRFENNFRISLTQGIVEIRGRTIDEPTPVGTGCYESEGFEEGYVFCFQGVPGNWLFSMETPCRGCSIFLTYNEAGVGGNTNSWDRLSMTITNYYAGLGLEGMCGTYDGDPTNDPDCTNTDPGTPQDCIDGSHQNND